MSDSTTVPTHLGLVLDGNRRWAKGKGKPTLEGYRKGRDNLKDIAKAAFDRGITYVSVYAFSTENWDRPLKEVNYLMKLAYRMLTHDIDELNQENIKLVWLGTADKLSDKMQKALNSAQEATKNNTRGELCLCFNYGGQQEIADSVKKILALGTILPEDITPQVIADNLYHPEIPNVDLLIRTSGEERISGFMLWRVAYSELCFTAKHWPDFSVSDLDKFLIVYSNRERRFGQ